MVQSTLLSLLRRVAAAMKAGLSCTLVVTVLAMTYVGHIWAQPSDDWSADFPYSRLEGSPVKSVGNSRTSPVRPLSWLATDSVPEQYDPLESVVDIEFGASIRTVGEATRQVLRPLGFELITQGQRISPLLPEMLAMPLPKMQRTMHHLRAREILRTLAGPGYVVVVDIVHRAVTFDPKPRYVPIGQVSTPNYNSVSIVSMVPSSTSMLSERAAVVQTAYPGESNDWVAIMPITTPSPFVAEQSKDIDIVSKSADSDEWVEITSSTPSDSFIVVQSLGVQSDEKPSVLNRADARDTAASGVIRNRVATALGSTTVGQRVFVTVQNIEGQVLTPDTLTALRRINAQVQKGEVVIVQNCSRHAETSSSVTKMILSHIDAPENFKQISDCDESTQSSTSKKDDHEMSPTMHIIEIIQPQKKVTENS